LLADFLIRGGHRRIAFIAGEEDSSTNRDREAGFYQGLASHGESVWGKAVGNYTFAGAAAATRELFTGDVHPDAVFVANDHMAFSVMDVLKNEMRLSIPEQVSVVGYDNVPEADWGGYRLTTVEQPCTPMIEAAASILVEQIEQGVVKRRAAVLPARLIVRESARIPD
jgi:DNA-binding LacI/PurR family transcriptional regulator